MDHLQCSICLTKNELCAFIRVTNFYFENPGGYLGDLCDHALGHA
jgi:hypothetical protein